MTFQVTLFSRASCHLCHEVEEDLRTLQAEIPHELVVVDIETDPNLLAAYDLKIPVVKAGRFTLEAPFDIRKLRVTLGSARDSVARQTEDYGKLYARREARRQNVSRGERLTYWISKRYLLMLNLFLFLYVGLPFLAPVLMNAGLPGLAKPIYSVYKVTCHQLSFRSWFLFGEQPVYPRAAAGVEGLIPYGEATGNSEEDLWTARQFIGNEQLGYKTAYCQRDVAIYLAMLTFGLLYAVTKRRIPPLPWYLWLLIGLGPIGIDGFSQLFSQIPWLGLPYRESTPFLRTLTGFLFGFCTAWFGFPLVEETMEDTRVLLATKIARVTSKSEE